MIVSLILLLRWAKPTALLILGASCLLSWRRSLAQEGPLAPGVTKEVVILPRYKNFQAFAKEVEKTKHLYCYDRVQGLYADKLEFAGGKSAWLLAKGQQSLDSLFGNFYVDTALYDRQVGMRVGDMVQAILVKDMVQNGVRFSYLIDDLFTRKESRKMECYSLEAIQYRGRACQVYGFTLRNGRYDLVVVQDMQTKGLLAWKLLLKEPLSFKPFVKTTILPGRTVTMYYDRGQAGIYPVRIETQARFVSSQVSESSLESMTASFSCFAPQAKPLAENAKDLNQYTLRYKNHEPLKVLANHHNRSFQATLEEWQANALYFLNLSFYEVDWELHFRHLQEEAQKSSAK